MVLGWIKKLQAGCGRFLVKTANRPFRKRCGKRSFVISQGTNGIGQDTHAGGNGCCVFCDPFSRIDGKTIFLSFWVAVNKLHVINSHDNFKKFYENEGHAVATILQT